MQSIESQIGQSNEITEVLLSFPLLELRLLAVWEISRQNQE